MAKHITYTCDICGKEITPEEWENLHCQNYHCNNTYGLDICVYGAFDSVKREVCTECRKELQEYVGKMIDRKQKGNKRMNDLENLPSTQVKRISKRIHEITESDEISYAVICDKFPSPCIYFNTYDEAELWARFDQPDDRPYYIVKRSEHFEIVGKVR